MSKRMDSGPDFNIVILALPVTGCVIPGKLLNVSESQFS